MDFIFSFIFSFFLKYETIVSRNGLSIGYSEQDTSSVSSYARTAFHPRPILEVQDSILSKLSQIARAVPRDTKFLISELHLTHKGAAK